MQPKITLDQVKALQDFGRQPRMHPNGFVQIDLNDDWRLHAWPSELLKVRPKATPIHNHSFDFISHVLGGRIVNTIHDFVESDEPPSDHENLERVELLVADRPKHDATGSNVRNTGRFGYMVPRPSQITYAGNSYFMKAEDFHSSDDPGIPSISMIQKLNMQEYAPLIANPLSNGEVESGFDRHAFDQKMLWDIIEEGFRYVET